MGIKDEYTAFCFDEACAFIITEMKEGNEPILNNSNENKKVSKPSDVYKKYNN
ncbi:MAG: hypothetical protein J6T10_22705 [Methanobrevibacter sp.]|nr:hypothetical protein [Methanobrevibacter sp.]